MAGNGEREPLNDQKEERERADESGNYGSTVEHDGNGANGKERAVLLDPNREYTPSEIIKLIGFGRTQVITVLIVFMGFLGTSSLLDLTAILSTRLYAELDMTSTMESTLGFVSFIGLALSYVISGLVADKIGKRNCVIVAGVWMLFWSVMTSLAWNATWVVVFRLMFSLAAGATNLLQPYSYEMQTSEDLWTGFLLGTFGGEAIARTLPIIVGLAVFTPGSPSWSWRIFVLILTIPVTIFTILAWFLMEESPRYLLTKGKTQESVQVLRKLAARNKIFISEELKLKPESELASVENSESTFFQKIKAIFETVDIFRSVLCVILIGIVCKYLSNGSMFIGTELLFMDGQSDTDYCQGSDEKSYFLDTHDYLKLLFLQVIISIGAGFPIYLTFRFQLNFKITAITLQVAAILLTAILYFCPKVMFGLSIVSIMQIISGVLGLNMTKSLTGLLPTNIRSGIFGISKSIMYIPTAFSVYLIQVLAKESQHYVTTVTLVFLGFGLLGALLLPKQLYAN